MEDLIQLLESVEKTNLPDNEEIVLNSVGEIKDLVYQILLHANTKLIDDNGVNIWENHDILKNHGFSIYPGEIDRFGWLTGCIGTKKGYIVYG